MGKGAWWATLHGFKELTQFSDRTTKECKKKGKKWEEGEGKAERERKKKKKRTKGNRKEGKTGKENVEGGGEERKSAVFECFERRFIFRKKIGE